MIGDSNMIGLDSSTVLEVVSTQHLLGQKKTRDQKKTREGEIQVGKMVVGKSPSQRRHRQATRARVRVRDTHHEARVGDESQQVRVRDENTQQLPQVRVRVTVKDVNHPREEARVAQVRVRKDTQRLHVVRLHVVRVGAESQCMTPRKENLARKILHA